jgi:hypothetical protein
MLEDLVNGSCQSAGKADFIIYKISIIPLFSQKSKNIGDGFLLRA